MALKRPKLIKYGKTSTGEYKELPWKRRKSSGLPKPSKPPKPKKETKTKLNKRLGRIVVLNNKPSRRLSPDLDVVALSRIKNARRKK